MLLFRTALLIFITKVKAIYAIDPMLNMHIKALLSYLPDSVVPCGTYYLLLSPELCGIFVVQLFTFINILV